MIEVGLRNAVDKALRNYFQNENWLLNKRNEFATHKELVKKNRNGEITIDRYFLEKLEKLEFKYYQREIIITHSKLLSELTFGFWVKFFDRNVIKILKAAPLNAFVNKPRINASLIYKKLNLILHLRNRIAHCEPICFDQNGNISIEELYRYEEYLIEVLQWINPKLYNWTIQINSYNQILERIFKLTKGLMLLEFFTQTIPNNVLDDGCLATRILSNILIHP